MYLCSPAAIFFCECTRSCRKRHMQVREEEPTPGVAQSQLERSLIASSLASQSPRESESSSTVSAGRPEALVSHDATMSRSSDAWADRAQKLSLGETRCGAKRKFGDPTLYHNPNNEVNQLRKAKTVRNVCQTFGVQEDSLGLRQFPVHQALWERSCEFQYVGIGPLGQGRGSVPTRDSECRHGERTVRFKIFKTNFTV